MNEIIYVANDYSYFYCFTQESLVTKGNIRIEGITNQVFNGAVNTTDPYEALVCVTTSPQSSLLGVDSVNMQECVAIEGEPGNYVVLDGIDQNSPKEILWYIGDSDANPLYLTEFGIEFIPYSGVKISGRYVIINAQGITIPEKDVIVSLNNSSLTSTQLDGRFSEVIASTGFICDLNGVNKLVGEKEDCIRSPIAFIKTFQPKEYIDRPIRGLCN